MGAAFNRNFVADHECGVKTNAELADNFNVLALFGAFFEIERAAFCNGTEVAFKLLCVHTAAVIGNFERSAFLVKLNLNFVIVS